MEFSEHQRLFLAAICSHFHTTGEWPTYGILDRKLRSHKGLEVDDIGRDLDGFMYDSMHAWPSGYDPDRTTFLCLSALHTCQLEGICPELANDLDAFMCVIQLCIERYEADEEAKPITAAEVQDRFGVADRPLRNAFRLVGDAGLTSMSNPGTAMAGEQADWSFTVFWTIRKYRHVETLEDLLGVRRQLLTATSSQMASPSRPTVASPRVFPPTRQEPMVAMSSNDRISSESASFPALLHEADLDGVTPAPGDSENPGTKYEFAVAISFAGPQRDLAERLATLVRDAGFVVFYDNFYADHLWGKDLPTFFDDIYRKKSLFCVPFISQEYVDRMWTTWERRSATTRLLEERGGEYILPIRVEDIDVPGIPSTIGHVSLAQYSIEEIADLLIKKLQRATAQTSAAGDVAS